MKGKCGFMDIRKHLSAEDLYKFGEMVQYYAIDNGDGKCNKPYPNDVPVNHLLRIWAEEKEYLYHLLGDKLDISKDIVCKKADEEVCDTIAEQISSNHYRDLDTFEAFFYNMADNIVRHWNAEKDNHLFHAAKEDYCGYFDSTGSGRSYGYSWLYSLQSLMDSKALYENRYTGVDIEIPIPDNDKTILLNRGMKVMRVLRKIAEAYHKEDLFEVFRLKHSQIMNDCNLKGQLHLSIHPLDFATSSMNDSKWRSCMDWDCGEFRRGTIEMMNSRCIICAYLVNGKNTYINRFGDEHFWNNKKWRQYIIVDPTVGIIPIKGYPYWNHNLEDICINWIKELINENYPGDYDFCKEIVTYNADKNEVTLDDGSIATVYFECGAMYNDFSYTCHRGLFVNNVVEQNYTHRGFYYSGPSMCLQCGEITDYVDDFDGESALVCNSCAPVERCGMCDNVISEDEGTWVDGIHVCEWCLYDLPDCDYCGNVHLSDYMSTYNIQGLDNKVYRYHTTLCECCADNLINSKDVGKLKVSPWRKIEFVNIKKIPKLLKEWDFENVESFDEYLQNYSSVYKEYVEEEGECLYA